MWLSPIIKRSICLGLPSLALIIFGTYFYTSDNLRLKFNNVFEADWVEAPGEVRHTFTHFHLRLRVMVAQVDAPQTNQTFTAAENFRPADLPTVMRKIWSMVEAET